MSIDSYDAGHVISTEATFATASDGYFDHLDLDHLWPYEQGSSSSPFSYLADPSSL